MATAVTGTTPTADSSSSSDASNPASLPTDAITYEDLYARWERGNWSAMDLDFTEDARQWREDFTEFERTAALWNYSLFFWGEDVVADNLSPYIDAAPLEEQKYFLATQQVDEARHAVFFKRFMHEVCGLGDGSMASSLNAIKPQLTPGLAQDLRPPGPDGRRAARRPLARPARRGGDALPHRDRGRARPARPALHLQLPGRARPAAGVQRGHAEHRRRRAAPHRLRRQAAVRPAPRRPGPRAQGGRRDPARRDPLHRPGADAPGLGRTLHHRASAPPTTRSASRG